MLYKYDKAAERRAIISLAKANLIMAGGTGGSAEQASHFVAEITGSFDDNQDGQPAMSMNSNTAEITAFGNDFGYENLFKRYTFAFRELEPTYLFITTSGTSKNIINAIDDLLVEYVYPAGKITLLTGNGMKVPQRFYDYGVNIITCEYPDTATIQECHMHILHNIARGIKFAI